MPLFAEIAVQSYITEGDSDSIFDYIVPDRYINIIKIGMRVVVPFGGKRLVEGYIINLKNSTDIHEGRLKPIADIPDLYRLFNEKQILLAKWVSQEYMCSLGESLKCIMPSEMIMKETKIITLINTDENTYDNMKGLQKKVIELLIESGGSIEINQLNKSLGASASGTIKRLVESGMVTIESRMDSEIKDKNVKGIKLKISQYEIEKLISKLEQDKRFKNQVEILNVLKSFEVPVIEKEFIDRYGFSKSTIGILIKKGIVDRMEIPVLRDPYGDVVFDECRKPVLTGEQRKVIDRIVGHSNNGDRNFIIHGVTGSGKTEVYMQLIEHVIKRGKQAIVLVPEISLTPQTIERFKGRFGRVAVIHSRLSAGERYDEWRKVKEGKVDVVVGARSAVFAPFNNLGIIIIDEEHETSYKSDKTPKYHAREVAYKRCELESALLVLGSATPGVETYYEALKGKYIICRIEKRVDDKSLPHIEVADMRQEIVSGNKTIFSSRLYEEIKDALANKNQIILFLNRRGFSTFVSCRKCGLVMKCPKCDVSLTYHMDRSILNCHYCGYTVKSPDICPECQSKYIKYFGIGTQKVESEVKKYFPYAKVLRMDLDTTMRKGSHDRIYNTFKKRQADILIGTQMVSKGLDFPGVTLVGIIAADLTLNIPDYRSCERTYQLVTQVSGRAGRGDFEGKVIVQTYDPEHYSIQAAVHHDYNEFYNKEILIRNTFQYPPFLDLINIVVSSNVEKEAIDIISSITYEIRGITEPGDNITVLGPSPAPISKINTYYRWQTIIKGTCDKTFKKKIKSIVNSSYTRSGKAKINFDINPVSMA